MFFSVDSVIRAEQLLEKCAVVDEGLALRLRADVGLLLRQVEGVSCSVVLHRVGVVHRDVGRALVEIVDRIATFAHHLSHESIRLTHRTRGIVDENALHDLPLFGVSLVCIRRQLDDVELLSLPFARNELLLGGALIAGLVDGAFVLRAEVFLQPCGFPAAVHGQDGEHHQRQCDQDSCCDKKPTPDGHFSYLLRGGYPTVAYGNVNSWHAYACPSPK